MLPKACLSTSRFILQQGMHFTPQSGETALGLPNILPEEKFNLPLALCENACHLPLFPPL